jgi:uncharacterized protein (TIGR03083 family)
VKARDVCGISPIGAAEATRLARTEYERFGQVLRSLGAGEWSRATECPEWDVRLLAAHVLGAAEANASPAEMAWQLWQGRRGIAIDVDAVSAVQVRDRRHLSPAGLLRRFGQAAPGAVCWRARWRRLAGFVPFRVGAPVHETWRLAYLMDVIYTRDVWMHRIDVCRATGREMTLTREHDGRVVADVVAEWGRRHGRPFLLDLAGPAGGVFFSGKGGAHLAEDAVEFCRAVSGRTASATLDTIVPF